MYYPPANEYAGPDFYVSTNGTQYGDGSESYPWNLETALTHPPNVLAGATIHLAAGTYNGDFTSEITGTAGQEITIQPANGASVKIDGSFTIDGAYAIVQDCEIAYASWTTRTTDNSGSTPEDITYTKTLTITGDNIELRRCIIHDLANVGWWTTSNNATLIECVIFWQGWSGPDRGHGHGVYTQNIAGLKTLERCIIFQNFSLGFKNWGRSAYTGYRLKDCILFDTGALYDRAGTVHLEYDALIGGQPGDVYADLIMDGCEIYRAAGTGGIAAYIGYAGGFDGFTLSNNYFVGDTALAFSEAPMLNGTMTGNVFSGSVQNVIPANWPGNTFQAYPSSGQRVRVIATTNGAHVSVFNFDGDSTVQADLTGIAIPSDVVTVWPVTCGFGNSEISLTVDGSNEITIPMTGHTPGTPTQWTAPDDLMPIFGAFVVTV